MEIKTNTILNRCRICLGDNQDKDLERLYEVDGTLTASGKLYEEELDLTIEVDTMDSYPQYLCRSCNLQLNLFRQLKARAIKTLVKFEVNKVKPKLERDEDSCLDDICEFQSIDGTQKEFDTLTESDLKLNEISARDEEILDIFQEVHEEGAEEFKNQPTSNASQSTTFSEEVLEITPNAGQSHAESDINSCEIDNDFEDVHYLEDTIEFEQQINKMKQRVKINAKRGYSCFICNIEFETRTKFAAHRRNVHSSKYPCADCDKLFQTSYALRVHKKLHNGVPVFRCIDCDKTFNQKVHYQYHMDRHNNVRKFICEVCKRRYISKADLNVHMRTHTGERRYTCHICSKSFLLLQHLKMHNYTHYEKQFECEKCHQKFISPMTLRTHVRTIHIDDPAYHCEMCVKSFRRKHHLIAHYKVHQRDKCKNLSKYNAMNQEDWVEDVPPFEAEDIDEIGTIDDDHITYIENSDSNESTILI